MLVIYACPLDAPGRYVVREWVIGPGTMTPAREAQICETLGAARGLVPEGYMRMERHELDDPAICEVWL